MAREGKSHYEELGVPRSAKESEIKRAFRRLALVHHPDRPGGNADIFKRAVEAYEVLIDRQKRTEYDQILSLSGNASRRSSAAEKAANSAASAAYRKQSRPDFNWPFSGSSFFEDATDSGSFPRFSNRRTHKGPFYFPFSFSFDPFDFPDPPFMRAEPDDPQPPPPRRPRSSRYEQMRTGQTSSFDSYAHTNANTSASEKTRGSWLQKAEAELRRVEAERRLAETERQRAEAERRMAEAERRRAATERLEAEAERQRAANYSVRAEDTLAWARTQQAQQDRARKVQYEAQVMDASQTQERADPERDSTSQEPASSTQEGGFVSNAPESDSSGAARSRVRQRHSQRRSGTPDSDADSSEHVESEPRAKRARIDPEIVDLTGEDTNLGKRKRSDADDHFNMANMQRVPPFTECHGESFNLNGVQSAIPNREKIRYRQHNRSRLTQPEQQPPSTSPEEARLWSEYVHESYDMYDKLFKLHNERNQLVDQDGSRNREAIVENLQETAKWLDILLQGTQKCISATTQ